ncbi:hypothetical protein F5051DRAFT_204686 [Lentinula edodes]|nr:hypothetical protein F5051DRAFT_204686 [Lentinula edodes]
MLLSPLPINISPSQPAPQNNCSPTPVNESMPRHRIHTNYKMSCKTTLSAVYQYPIDTILEYPETGATLEEVVGHLFQIQPNHWISPERDFTYSRGEPRGNSKEGITNPLLVHRITGEMVPCIAVKPMPWASIPPLGTPKIYLLL